MTDKTQPTQAMPSGQKPDEPPRPTQPIDTKHKPKPLTDSKGFDTFMGHGGQSDITDETEEDGGNPNATAQSD